MITDVDALSPFELSLYLESRVPPAERNDWLDAGRGNPNWTAPVPRAAYFLLGDFATQETLHVQDSRIAGQITPQAQRLTRFKAFLAEHQGPGADFLTECLSQPKLLGMSAEAWLTAACDAIIGDNYPAPARCLDMAAQPLKTYLDEELFAKRAIDFDVFPVEGGTAGICYLFDTLIHTHLLDPGDRIALFLPTFAPYLEIPELPQYHFDVVKVRAKQVITKGQTQYQYSVGELDKLRDPRIKAAFVVNPSNPTANAMSVQTLAALQKIVNDARPDLLILTDDVYGTFVPHFMSIFATLPYNTACLYSFSKYFGATGWRVGAIAIAKHNVFDDQIRRLGGAPKDQVLERYESLSPDPEAIHFIDRLVADSRDIALHHAAGLSTPQQLMIALFSLYGLLQDGAGYQQEVIGICRERERILFTALGLPPADPHLDTAYYVDIDLMQWVTQRYGQAFAKKLKIHSSPTQILVQLAERKHLLLLKTSPFGSDAWSVRISLANLATSQYQQVGARIIALFDDLHRKVEA
ncbi:aspartate 4-decarboxylase [Lacticaseibacillus manihotivorans]|uniref:Aminotransferase n=2 Tax=Lacticaseibacillus manihotivorans TaxID=88233 RepID=A0A0R1QLK5_9LACO|nr:aspartate 4-decarboxylase [Lacticaseibacillus manihotivorans]KRL45385.1 aspartate aminotransferase [Lacticaseibacillus manihotivorans DSM 13343 = JCM 12514]QFQ92112.1 aspartate 4-decarboxylase [Lacticaseibacillus manihotivorans]